MTLPPLLDAHLHLQDKRFDGHVDNVIQRAEKSGIKQLFCNATREDDWQEVIDLGRQYRCITPFLGVHPWFSDSLSNDWLDHLQKLLTSSNYCVGETGLDKKCAVDMALQMDVFSAQLKLAVQLERPIVIHCIGCWGKLIDLLEEQLNADRSIPVMIHSFSGPLEIMKRLVSLGCHLSFSARLIDSNNKKLQNTFLHTPLDHILLETDSPDQLFSSTPLNTHLNEPSFIIRLYRTAAEIKEIEYVQFIHHIWENGTIFTN